MYSIHILLENVGKHEWMRDLWKNKAKMCGQDVKEMRCEVGLVHLTQVRLDLNCGLQCTL
jgi:hypothetical protein